MSDLKPCQCGKTPEKLFLREGSTFRWRYICGDCDCGWETEVRVPTIGDTSEEAIYESCVEGWNALPRGGDRIAELEAQLAEALYVLQHCMPLQEPIIARRKALLEALTAQGKEVKDE